MVCLSFLIRRPFLQGVDQLVFVFGILLLPLLLIDMFSVNGGSTGIHEVARIWKDQPKMSRHISFCDNLDSCFCNNDVLPLSRASLPRIRVWCGCQQNSHGYWTTFVPHILLDALHFNGQFSRRGNILCYKSCCNRTTRTLGNCHLPGSLLRPPTS